MIRARRYPVVIAFTVTLWSLSASAQTFTWTPIASDLPASIKIFSGTATGPIRAYYAEVDYGDTLLRAMSLRSSTSAGKETVSSFASKSKAYVAINGGFFGGTPASSYSLVVSDGRLAAKQIGSVSRSSGTYPLMRANFGILKDRTLQTAWIYHFDNDMTGIYRYAAPLPHTQSTPAPAPLQQNGTPWANLLDAIGGGPNLVSNGQINVTYDQEVMFGSGVGLDNGDPRSAIGYTAGGKIILFVVDGRQTISIGMSLPQVAQAMIDLGCVEAVNLDGGGSSTLYAGGSVRNSPSDGAERQVASAFVIVAVPSYEVMMDTDHPRYTETGTGWMSALNEGYFGTQKTRIVQSGSGDRKATFRFTVPAEATYDVFAWWTAYGSRATNTPHIIYSKGRVDTVRVDQVDVSLGSKWNFLGSFVFSGGGEDSVVITNEASGVTNPSFIAVDGLRLISYEPSLIVGVPEAVPVPASFGLLNNYPNPFNSSTTISFRMAHRGRVSLRIFDALGRKLAELAGGEYPPGEHSVVWDAGSLPSGVYFCRFGSADASGWTKMVLLR